MGNKIYIYIEREIRRMISQIISIIVNVYSIKHSAAELKEGVKGDSPSLPEP